MSEPAEKPVEKELPEIKIPKGKYSLEEFKRLVAEKLKEADGQG